MAAVEQRIDGYWWLPGEPDRRIPGTLTIAVDGRPTVELDGGFVAHEAVPVTGEVDTYSPRALPPWPIVHGECGREAFTLVDTTAGRQTGGLFGDIDSQTLLPLRVVRGVHLAASTERQFQAGRFEIDHLLFWSGMTVLSTVPTRDDHGVAYGASSPRVAQSVMWRNFRIELAVEGSMFSASTTSANTRRVHADERATLTVISQDATSIGELERVTKMLQDLLTIALNRPCGTRSRAYATRRDAKGELLFDTSVYGRQVYQGPDESPPNLGGTYFFRMPDMDVEAAIPAWLDLYDNVSLAIQMIAGQRYLDVGYTATKLLTTCTAVEALHRGKFGCGKQLPTAEFRRLKRQVRAGVDQALLDVHPIPLSNDLTYAQRARELAAVLRPDVVGSLVGDVESWVQLTKRARNLLAHASHQGPDLSPELQFRLARITQTLLMLVLAEWVSIPTEIQHRFVTGGNEVPIDVEEYQRLAAKFYASD